MTNDYKKGTKYRMKTDRNFRVRYKKISDNIKRRKELLERKGIPRSQWHR